GGEEMPPTRGANNTGRPPRRKAADDAHRPRGVGLRPRDARDRRQRGGARGEMQECTAGSFMRPFPRFSDRYSRNIGDQSGLMFANLTTLAPFSVSSAMSFLKSAGEPGRGVPPISANRVLALGSARIALISLLSRSTISGGVALGALMPKNALAS